MKAIIAYYIISKEKKSTVFVTFLTIFKKSAFLGVNHILNVKNIAQLHKKQEPRGSYWLDLVLQGTIKGLLQHYSSKALILWFSAFFMVQLSHL